ncbi:hypothetical protein [Nocardioides sp. Root190]|uniref:hypothetical protein n=1 Tax=Nocardioides sp. Root190 TaxID=1736488 RepID=UPI000A7E97E1|nr:hypothetical protein [Nocardioides sp. Root190]
MSAEWTAALRRWPDAERLGEAEYWDELLADRPDVMHRLLADIYRATYAWDTSSTP